MEKPNHKIYSCRDEQIRLELTIIEVIRLIREVYHQEYNSNLPNFDAWDQLLACEAVAESVPVKDVYYKENERENENVSVNGNVNDSYKREVNFQLTQSKQEIISKLREFNYRTPPKKIAELLNLLFQEFPSKPSHWPYIAQTYTPLIINRVIKRLVKLHNSGRTILNPAAYFTEVIKHRAKRKNL